MPEIHVEIDHIYKSFMKKSSEHPTRSERLSALEDITFDVKQDEFLCILGPSGCGKTTLLRLVAGLTFPDSGAVRITGKRARCPNRAVALVFQDIRLFPWRNVESNVWIGLEFAGVSETQREKLADKYIDLVGLSEFKNSHPHQLSGGMQQRVGLARALAVNPSILLMDEPFGSLDAQTRERLQDELLRIMQEEKKTVMFVTHDIREAIYLGDRVVLLTRRPGRLHEILDIDLPRPRSSHDKASRKFQELTSHAWHKLMEGIRQ